MTVKAVDPLLGYFERVEPGIVLVAHLVFRVSVLVFPLQGWWNPPVLRVVAVLLIGYDVALAWSLRRGTPPPRWVRWALDLAELAFWSAVHAPDEPYSGVWAITAPMITMTTVRHGLLVSGTVAAALVGFACVVRLAAGTDPFVVDALLWAGMYLIGGQCLIALLASEVRRQRRLAQALWDADVTAAELDGRNEILAGRGADLIDELQTTIMRLSASGVDASVALRGSVSRHKLDLARQTRERALYLRDAFDLYAQAVRSRQPAVARHVFFDVSPGAAVCVVTAAQADQLGAQLAQRDLRGVVPVSLVDGPTPGAPGGNALTCEVGGVRHVLAGEPPRVALPLAPAGMALLAMYIARTAVNDSAPVPAAFAFPMAALTAGYAALTWWLVRRRGPAWEPWLSLGVVVPFAVSAAITTYFAHHGVPRTLTSSGHLLGLGFVLGTIVRPRALMWCAIAVQLIATALVVVTAPPAALGRAAGELVWMAAAFIGAHVLARSLDSLSRDVSDRLAHERATATAAAHRRSQDHELEYLRAALAQGRGLAREAPPGPVRSSVEADLDRIGAGLAELRQHYAEAQVGPPRGRPIGVRREHAGGAHAHRGG